MTALPRHGRDGVTDDSGRCEAAKPSSSSGSNPPVPVGEAAATNLKTVQALVQALLHFRYRGLLFDYDEQEIAEYDAAVTAGSALIEQMKREQEAQPTSEAPAVVDPTDPGHDVEVLRNHVRVLERRVRDLHRERNEAPAAKAVRMLTEPEAVRAIINHWHKDDDEFNKDYAEEIQRKFCGVDSTRGGER